MSRFRWLARQLSRSGSSPRRVIEIGCFDGSVIDYLPSKPTRYLGLDANWEGGLASGRERWVAESGFEFRECHTPADMEVGEERFDVAICMETLEHIPANVVNGYLRNLSAATDGYLFVTVPNEKGVLFLLKYLTKRIMYGDAEPYTIRELVNATLGRLSQVERDEHKGFDYSDMIRQISRHYEILHVTGIPFGLLPKQLGFTIGIVGKTRSGRALNPCVTTAPSASS